jgi:hypothetical protein
MEQLGRGHQPDPLGPALSPGFSTDTAAKTGLTARTVQQDLWIASKVSKELCDTIRNMPLGDNKRDLLDLAGLPENEQHQVVDCLKEGRVKNYKEAKRSVEARSAANPEVDETVKPPPPSGRLPGEHPPLPQGRIP